MSDRLQKKYVAWRCRLGFHKPCRLPVVSGSQFRCRVCVLCGTPHDAAYTIGNQERIRALKRNFHERHAAWPTTEYEP